MSQCVRRGGDGGTERWVKFDEGRVRGVFVHTSSSSSSFLALRCPYSYIQVYIKL